MSKSIHTLITDYARKNKPFKVTDVVESFNHKYSRQYVSKIVQELVKAGVLVQSGVGINIRYTHKNRSDLFKQSFERRYKNSQITEEDILNQIREEHFFKDKLSENIIKILEYALSEIINNAIEHSKSKSINVQVVKEENTISFTVTDYGIGVFKNVMDKFDLKNEYEAINELLKGKTTTQPELHSGEGIFFTSKISDLFFIDSKGLKLLIDNKIDDLFIQESKENPKGSTVYFEIDNNSDKNLTDIFKEYQSNPQSYKFDKTKITIKLYTLSSTYISRSQARRLLNNLEKFNYIILDFKNVETVGQAFADEIFRVYKKKRPNIVIETINTNPNIEFMIKRVEQDL